MKNSKLIANSDIEPIIIHPPTKGYRNNKHKMKNMSTTLEIPEGSKATIQGKGNKPIKIVIE